MANPVPDGSERVIINNATKNSNIVPGGMPITINVTPDPQGVLTNLRVNPEEKLEFYLILEKIKTKLVTFKFTDATPRARLTAYEFKHSVDNRTGKTSNVTIRIDDPNPRFYVTETHTT
jgi:hypothetical protein